MKSKRLKSPNIKIGKDIKCKNKDKSTTKIMPKRSSRNLNQNSNKYLAMNTEPIKPSIPKKQTFPRIIKIEYAKNDKETISYHPIKYQVPSTNIQKKISYHKKIANNQPINSVIPLRDMNNNFDITDRSNMSNILSSRTNFTDFVNVNDSSLNIRCPFCNHDLSQEQKFNKKSIIKSYNTNNETINVNKSFFGTEKPLKIKKMKKMRIRNITFNEKGGVVFKQNTTPTISIRIVKKRIDLSKYINDSKVLGKKKNIGIMKDLFQKLKFLFVLLLFELII